MAASLAPLGMMLGLALVSVVLTHPAHVRRLVARIPRRRRAQRIPDPVHRPLQVVAADLRRLGRQLAVVPTGAPIVRRRALLSAYDAVLIEAAELLEVPHQLGVTSPLGMAPAADPFEPALAAERVRLLAALEDAGLAVRA
jgi:hypothetical protein